MYEIGSTNGSYILTRPPQSKILRNDGDNMYVMTCQEVEIQSPEEAFELLYKGKILLYIGLDKQTFSA